MLAAVLVLAVSLTVFAAKTDTADSAEYYSYSMKSVNGEEISSETNLDSVTVMIFLSVSDNNGFLTLDDIQYSDWIKNRDVKVVAVDVSGRTDTELENYREYYGFTGIDFCVDKNKIYFNEIAKYLGENPNEIDCTTAPFTVIIDKNGMVRNVFDGYQKPDDLKEHINEVLAEPKTPIKINAVSDSYNSVKLTWQKNVAVGKYKIYRAEKFDGDYLPIGYSDKNEFIDTGLETGKSYFYVLAHIVNVGGSETESERSSPILGRAVLSAPAVTAAQTDDGVSLSFTQVYGADGYRILRSKEQFKDYEVIEGQLTDNEFVDENVTDAEKYYYKVSAYIDSEDSVLYGKMSSPVTNW